MERWNELYEVLELASSGSIHRMVEKLRDEDGGRIGRRHCSQQVRRSDVEMPPAGTTTMGTAGLHRSRLAAS
jgi:hypothetical protein